MHKGWGVKVIIKCYKQDIPTHKNILCLSFKRIQSHVNNTRSIFLGVMLHDLTFACRDWPVSMHDGFETGARWGEGGCGGGVVRELSASGEVLFHVNIGDNVVILAFCADAHADEKRETGP